MARALILAALLIGAASSALAQEDPLCPNVRSSLQGAMWVAPGYFPRAGTVASVEAGQPMVFKGQVGRYPARLILERPIDHRGDGGRDGGDKVQVPAGSYVPMETFGNHVRIPVEQAVLVSKKGETYPRPRVWFALERNTERVYLMWDTIAGRSENRRIEPPKTWYRLEYCQTPASGGFSSQIDYIGVADGVMKLTYREFFDGWSRPAFSEDLFYDLKGLKEITFRGVHIEIIEVNNIRVTFRVLKGLQ